MVAALGLLAESGPDGLAIEKVAERAGVGKATIYRRWPGKEELLLDAVSTLRTELPVPQGRSVRADLAVLLTAMCAEAADPTRARLAAVLRGGSGRYPRLAARFAETDVRPRRQAVETVLRRGVATGELREDTDVAAAAALLTGAALAPVPLAGVPGAGTPGAGAADARYARRVVDELMRGLAAR
jgi:AcrR family transcriptional regulator